VLFIARTLELLLALPGAKSILELVDLHQHAFPTPNATDAWHTYTSPLERRLFLSPSVLNTFTLKGCHS